MLMIAGWKSSTNWWLGDQIASVTGICNSSCRAWNVVLTLCITLFFIFSILSAGPVGHVGFLSVVGLKMWKKISIKPSQTLML